MKIGDAVRIINHPDQNEFDDLVGVIVERNVEADWHGPFKIDVRSRFTWFYCMFCELQEVSSSDRLYYGI